MADLINTICAAVRRVLPEEAQPIELHEPLFAGNEWSYVKDCIDTGWVSTAGQYVSKFEKAVADYTGTKHAIAVVNGTAALHVCLMMAGVESGDEVLLPALTFVATANAVTYCGAAPHFVDSDERTLGVDPQKIAEYLKDSTAMNSGRCFNKKTGKPIKTLIAMHTFGHPVDMDPLIEICGRHGIVLIEDAAESLGSYYKGRHTGHSGFISAMSFNGNKIATTGGGGAVLTNDEKLAKRCRHVTTTAKAPHAYEFNHDEVGYNYRMPNINAALGCAQMERLGAMLAQKRNLAERYLAEFAAVEGVRVFLEPAFAKSNYWLNAILLDQKVSNLKDKCIENLREHRIMARPAWTLMHKLPMFEKCPRANLATAEDLERRLINLPSSARLGAGT